MAAENKFAGEDVAEDTGAAQAASPVAVEKLQSAAERKARKAMQKKGLEQVAGINSVTIIRKNAPMFSFQSPDVYRNATSDTWIVFGEPRIENLGKMMRPRAQQSAKAAAAAAPAPAAIPEPVVADPATFIDDEAVAATANEDSVDESGLESKDIELVMAQAGCTRAKAVAALKHNANDLISAIMELTG
ncbi:hypothetical protein GGH91_005956 [Coemansia sp. RSA 2671]|uniref:Nascent polypeptide-associated complex subunit alpha n=2 Tax=Coemansia TaxID=4863 RepID=A0A9W8GEL5_9FUNG|nr:hypothetical protein GGI06_003173 [Coemansia sp. S85]KAJ2022308.1 hypothetical protein IWW57_004576 [Coemansia sp. S610]KAJ2333368.1 hypothetical protein GGH91_005956 [Coemansia sp. RSA 2671]KAJ2374387.1 hypothetical protein H4S02_008559 [Coemansia sp. RSA 2611]KAJ2687196.1 hypothetical protein IWW39_003117 [Coemansia spiralis]KAJ2764348.1 hypothetical protein GGI18_006469 [Coemansia linderi]